MPRLIDADALIKRAAMRGHCLRPFVTAYHMCVDVKDIEKAPTIDAVPVVRCRDCKWCADRKRYLRCVRRGFTAGYEVKLSDFCSYGERRSDA